MSAATAEAHRVHVTDAPDLTTRATILKGLNAHDARFTGRTGSRPLAALVQDARGRTVGGLLGRTRGDWLVIELMHLPESLRGRGLGRAVLRAAEEEAAARGCVGCWLDTYAFQARAFYEREGYAAFGEIPDYVAGHTRVFLSKRPLRRAGEAGDA